MSLQTHLVLSIMGRLAVCRWLTYIYLHTFIRASRRLLVSDFCPDFFSFMSWWIRLCFLTAKRRCQNNLIREVYLTLSECRGSRHFTPGRGVVVMFTTRTFSQPSIFLSDLFNQRKTALSLTELAPMMVRLPVSCFISSYLSPWDVHILLSGLLLHCSIDNWCEI